MWLSITWEGHEGGYIEEKFINAKHWGNGKRGNGWHMTFIYKNTNTHRNQNPLQSKSAGRKSIYIGIHFPS